MNKRNTKMPEPKQVASRRGFLMGSVGASGLAVTALASPTKAADVLLAPPQNKGTGVSAGNLSEHARKYYRSTTI
jgi:hypothetical protein